jgi:hypothetical protein
MGYFPIGYSSAPLPNGQYKVWVSPGIPVKPMPQVPSRTKSGR